MKKFTTLTTDCTTLATEVMAQLNSMYDVEDEEHRVHAFHPIPKENLSNTSLDTTFAGLTSKDIMHATVNFNAMFNHSWDTPFVIIPLVDCETAVVKIFDTVPGAVLQETTSYASSDCILTDTIPLTSPIVIGQFTTFTVQTTDWSKLSDVLFVWFNEDISTLLA